MVSRTHADFSNRNKKPPLKKSNQLDNSNISQGCESGSNAQRNQKSFRISKPKRNVNGMANQASAGTENNKKDSFKHNNRKLSPNKRLREMDDSKFHKKRCSSRQDSDTELKVQIPG